MGEETTLERIHRSWTALQETIGRLDDRQLAAPGPDGWSIKDHLGHVADWEEILLVVLDGGAPSASMGVGQDGIDAENAALRERHVDQLPSEVRDLLAETHARTVTRLTELGEEGLARPYSAYQPAATRPDREEPVLGWVLGNTSEHYDEHRGWIQDLAGLTDDDGR